VETALSAAEALEFLAQEHGMTLHRILAKSNSGWARGRLHDPAAGAEEIRRALGALAKLGGKLDPVIYAGLAELEAETLGVEKALERVDQALALTDQSRFCLSLLHHLRSELLLKRDPPDSVLAEQALQTAIAAARQQGARSFELRAALSLAKLYQSTGRPADALAVLAPALEGFSPTQEMPEIAEAQALLAALDETEEVKTYQAHRARRLHLQAAYGQAMMWSKGFAAEETKAAITRAAELAESTQDLSKRFTALTGQIAGACTGGELRAARELALTLLREAEDARRVREAAMANFWLGMVTYWRGDFVDARTYCERALAARDPNPDPEFRERFGDGSNWASPPLAATVWQLGELERARELMNMATRRASELGHIGAIGDALFWKSYLEIWRGDPLATLSAAGALEPIAREHGLQQYLNEAELHSGWARGRMKDSIAGAARVRRVLAAFVEQGVRVNLGFYTGLLAQLEAETLGAESALARIDEAFRLSNQVEHGCSLPFLHRLRGEILFKRNPTDPAPAEEAFRTSIAIAKEQSARSPVLLASLALARLLQSTGRLAEAHAVLAPALDGFSQTPEMPQIAEAQMLLAALAETNEVKTAAVARRRRLKLQTDYGQAMLFSKGYGAEETRAAFADALKIASGTADAAGRFDAYYGVCAGSLDRGDLTLARQTAETFRREAGDGAYAPSLVRACVCLGLTILTQGDPAGARAHLEEALKIYEPGRDRETKLRFGVDVGALATVYLGTASWLLGNVAQARELIDQATARTIQSQRAPTRAFISSRMAQLGAVRGDAEATLSKSETMVELSQEHGITRYLAWGKTYRGWATARLGHREAGVKELREGLADLADQGSKVHVPLYQALLAQIEAEMGESALSRIEGALALAQETGEHWSDSFLQRIRGESLLKLDPANAATAEQAFRAAIAIAQAQKARSFELQASLSLAQLYQSTARPADALAGLAPALEGFSPTREMPEIAEAQALLELLSRGGEVAIAPRQAT
jgi:predicted ATPase